MPGIALDLGGAAVLYGDQHTAGVGAIVRARGMDDVFHAIDYKGGPERGRGVKGRQRRAALSIPHCARGYILIAEV